MIFTRRILLLDGYLKKRMPFWDLLYLVFCPRCKNAGPLQATAEFAIAAWNTRIASVPPHPEVAGLVERLKSIAERKVYFADDGNDPAIDNAIVINKAATALTQLAAENADARARIAAK